MSLTGSKTASPADRKRLENGPTEPFPPLLLASTPHKLAPTSILIIENIGEGAQGTAIPVNQLDQILTANTGPQVFILEWPKQDRQLQVDNLIDPGREVGTAKLHKTSRLGSSSRTTTDPGLTLKSSSDPVKTTSGNW